MATGLLPQSAKAGEQFDIGWDGKTLFNIKYYGASDYTEERSGFFQRLANKGYSVLNYDLTSDIKSGLNKAFKWWAEIFQSGQTVPQFDDIDELIKNDEYYANYIP